MLHGLLIKDLKHILISVCAVSALGSNPSPHPGSKLCLRCQSAGILLFHQQFADDSRPAAFFRLTLSFNAQRFTTRSLCYITSPHTPSAGCSIAQLTRWLGDVIWRSSQALFVTSINLCGGRKLSEVGGRLQICRAWVMTRSGTLLPVVLSVKVLS